MTHDELVEAGQRAGYSVSFDGRCVIASFERDGRTYALGCQPNDQQRRALDFTMRRNLEALERGPARG